MQVLIAEDEPLVAKVLERHLEHYARRRALALDSLIAYDGIAAVRAAQDPKRQWTAILLDYHLPLLDGEGIWRSLVIARPEMLPRVIFVTQAPDELKVEHDDGRVPILAKPFPFESLATCLDHVLELKHSRKVGN